MAKPTYYPDWATQTVTLPGTGNTNKIRPKETIRTVGMDFGQVMTCEEVNWWFNNIGLWIHYLNDEFIPTLPKTYLPIVGTKITMAGDATGSVTWNGNAAVTLSIQVVDNSHNHVSANISDATTGAPTPNVLVKRDANGGVYAGDTYVCGTSSTDAATIFFHNFAKQTVGNISSTYNSGGNLTITRLNPAGGAAAGISLFDAGYVQMNNPRSSNGQEGQANSLVRLDYLNSRLSSLQSTLQNSINQVQTNLTNATNNLQTQITNNYNYANGTFVRDMRLGAMSYIVVDGYVQFTTPGWVCAGMYCDGNKSDLDGLYWRALQKNVNGTWYTIGAL